MFTDRIAAQGSGGRPELALGREEGPDVREPRLGDAPREDLEHARLDVDRVHAPGRPDDPRDPEREVPGPTPTSQATSPGRSPSAATTSSGFCQASRSGSSSRAR